MKLKRRQLLSLLWAAFTGLLLFSAVPPSMAQPARAPKVHALLIGIGDYPSDSGVLRLDGPANDVRLISTVLRERFQVPSSNVTVLTDKAATHTAIEAAFRALASRMKRDDIVYIHYSGHGATWPDPGESRSRQDQSWVSYGARSTKHAGKDHLDVLDKEIALWMQPLYALSDDVVFVSDSCHSASVSRGRLPLARFAPPASSVAPHPLLAELPRIPAPVNGLRIGAARDHESARELNPKTNYACDDKKQCYGVFTWYWAKALRETQPGDAWADVFQRASALVSAVDTVSQLPQIDGSGDREVFGGAFAPVSKALAITQVGADGKTVELRGGLLSGVSIGSTFEGRGALLKVTSVQPLTSEALVQKGSLSVGDLVTEVSHSFSSRPIRLYVTGDAAKSGDEDLIRSLSSGLKAATSSSLSAFEIVRQEADADWIVYVVRRASTATEASLFSQPMPNPCLECPARIEVVAKDGTLLHESLRTPVVSVNDSVAWLVTRLRKLSWSREVRKLAAEGNRLPVSLAVTIYRPAASTTEKCPASNNPDPASWTRIGPYPLQRVGTPPVLNDCLSFTLENRDPDRSFYGYVVAIGPDLAVNRVFPARNQVEDDARLRPKEAPVGTAFYRLNSPGRETIMLLTSEGPVPTVTLEQSGVKGALASSQLGRLLASKSTRGEVVAGPVTAWGAEATELSVPPSPSTTK